MTKYEQIQKLKEELESTKSEVLRQAIKEKIKSLEANDGIQK